ncbi:MAG TPA: hypothetical protein VIQ05_19870 [Tardiphaga sp.]
MVVVPKPTISLAKAEKKQSVFVDLGIICAAVVFVAVLLLTYGIDLSPGLF